MNKIENIEKIVFDTSSITPCWAIAPSLFNYRLELGAKVLSAAILTRYQQTLK